LFAAAIANWTKRSSRFTLFLDLTGETDFEIGAIKAADPGHAAFAGADPVPEVGNFKTQRRHNTQAGDNDSTTHPCVLPSTDTSACQADGTTTIPGVDSRFL